MALVSHNLGNVSSQVISKRNDVPISPGVRRF
jgi:hypothetical protein